jgi:small subunit ribosomal protein S17
MPKRKFIGKVISNKMQKTVVVEVEKVKRHPLYKRTYKVHKKYHAHDEIGCKIGDKVLIEESRPISKTKRWKVIKKL